MDNFVFAEAKAYISKGALGVMADIGGSPRVAASIAAGTASMGTMAKLELLQNTLGSISLLVGIMTGCVVFTIQVIKLIREYRAFKALAGFAIQQKGPE